MTGLPTPDVLADKFAAVLKGWLTPDQLKEVIRRNGGEQEGSQICHSHDFCDANMAMDEAMRSFGVDDILWSDRDQALVDLWNAAWDIAAQKYLGRRGKC